MAISSPANSPLSSPKILPYSNPDRIENIPVASPITVQNNESKPTDGSGRSKVAKNRWMKALKGVSPDAARKLSNDKAIRRWQTIVEDVQADFKNRREESFNSYREHGELSSSIVPPKLSGIGQSTAASLKAKSQRAVSILSNDSVVELPASQNMATFLRNDLDEQRSVIKMPTHEAIIKMGPGNELI